MTDSAGPQDSSATTQPPVVGARLIVDILRHFAGVPPETVQLTPLRNKAAHFVLEKSLLKIEQQAATLTYPVPQMGVASALHQFARNEKKILYMAQADWGAAKLIDAVFDGVIDQGKLDAEGVWLLNRFRLPLFHAVLSDFSFFFARQNLARRFINAVTLHLLTTREPFARDLKFVLGGIASRMHEAFEQGAGKFNALCVEGQTWFATQQQRLQKAELKIREHIETRTRRQAAEERVITLLNRCIADKPLPTLLLQFLLADWRQLLLWTSTKEGEQGLHWKRQSRLTESMVEFAQACQTETGRAQYQNFLPSLIKGLQGSLREMLERDDRVHQVLEPVELVLSAMAMGVAPEYSSHSGLALSDSGSPSFEVVIESNPATERILALAPGQWVRFRTQDRQYEACTLVLKGEGGEPWRFVNQTGQGVVSKTVMQLAQLLTSGVLEIVGEGNAIDEVMVRAITQAAAVLPKPPTAGKAATLRTAEPTPAIGDITVSEPASCSDDDVNSAAASLLVPTGESQPNDSLSNNTRADAASATAGEASAKHTTMGSPGTPATTRELLKDSEPSAVTDDPVALAALDASLRHSEQQEGGAATDSEGAAAYPEEVMQAAFAAVDGLQIGARLIWYKSQDEDVTLKLAVKIRSTGKLVLVNHIGIKTLDTDRNTLAGLIASGRIVIIDIGAKFDSALERIVKHIQQDKK